MAKKILLILAGLIAALAIVIATRPDSYHVERSADVAAPPDRVFELVGDLRAWQQWSPWEKRDPNMKKTFSTATTGVGASYAWEGNKDVGKGQMTIVESHAPQRVATRLDFIEPFQSTAQSALDLKSEGAVATRVTWSMDGKQNFMSKAFSLVMDMDKMIGKDFEEGLSTLKGIAEAKVAADAAKAPPPAAEATAGH
jgi:uncharacterized protein YndB with AHSA1/START domain